MLFINQTKPHNNNFSIQGIVQYTRDCAAVLSDLLGDTEHGSISTLPLGWGDPWNEMADSKAR